MTDKYPEIPIEGEDIEGSDFLSRENELLGDEFKTEQDHEVLNGSDEDDEINNFKAQFPDVHDDEEAEQAEEDDDFEDFESSKNTDNFEYSAQPYSGESKHLNEWKERRQLEISQREAANSKKKEDIVAKAQQTIDDFYDNYNNKKETTTKRVAKEQEEFLEKRDGFLKRGTLWDRVGELVNDVGEVGGDRDKSRFKGLLKSLKGKEGVPGAGGY